MEKLTVSVAEAAQMLGISRNSMYDLTESAGFPVIRAGTRKVIPIAEFKQWIGRQRNAEEEVNRY